MPRTYSINESHRIGPTIMNNVIKCPSCEGTGKTAVAEFLAEGEASSGDQLCKDCNGTGRSDLQTIIKLRSIYLIASLIAHQHQHRLPGGWDYVWEVIETDLQSEYNDFFTSEPNWMPAFSKVSTDDTSKSILLSDRPRQGDDQLKVFIAKRGSIDRAKQILGI